MQCATDGFLGGGCVRVSIVNEFLLTEIYRYVHSRVSVCVPASALYDQLTDTSQSRRDLGVPPAQCSQCGLRAQSLEVSPAVPFTLGCKLSQQRRGNRRAPFVRVNAKNRRACLLWQDEVR